MDFAVQVCAYLIAVPLQLLTIRAMLRGGFRAYPLVFAYLIAALLTTAIEMPLSLAYYSNKTQDAARNYMRWYWRDEALIEVLIFAVVINLIYLTTSKLESRRIVRLLLISGGVLFVAITFLITYEPNPKQFFGVWATRWVSQLKFCAAILDLALWAMLIGVRKKDYRLLMLSCGLGIMFAGGAIGEALRNLASAHEHHALSYVGSLIMLTADTMLLYIWWRAFRKDSVTV
jgi:hypothetical protein